MAVDNSGSVEQAVEKQALSRGSLVRRLIIIALVMFGFGYALVPLYEVFCRVTGFGGKTDIVQEAAANKAVLSDREVEVTFTSHSHTSLPWEFKPITPGEEQEMAVRFLLDAELPDDVHELTLSYTFFDNEKHAGQ